MEVNQSYFDLSLKNKQSNPGESHFFGHGKLLISGEYVLLEGAQASPCRRNLDKICPSDMKSHLMNLSCTGEV